MKGEPLPMNENDVTTDALTIAQVLRGLGPREREEITAAAFDAALQALPEADRLAIHRLANVLSDRVRGIGDRMALDILGAVGVLWAGRP
jgi:hypothetical protein